MRDTYNALKQTAELLETENVDKMVLLYQDNNKRDMILAKMYCDNIGYLVNRSSKYISIDDEDKSSFALESIHKALLNYDVERNAKLISLIGLYFERKLKNKIKRQSRQKRKIDKEAVSLDEEFSSDGASNYGADRDMSFKNMCTKDNSIIQNTSDSLKNFSDSFLKMRINESNFLTEKQKMLCNLLLDKGGDYQNIADKLNISQKMLVKRINSLKKVNLLEIIS